jgi:hypothetical protein
MTAVIHEGASLFVDEPVAGVFDLTNTSASAANVDIGGLVLTPGQMVTGVADGDADGVPNSMDACPLDFTAAPGVPPCDDDADDDSELNAMDNCITWPNQGQALPAWPVPADDYDCDGFKASIEDYSGAGRFVQCPATATPNDEATDAWPPDFDDSRSVNIVDVLALKTVFNVPEVFAARFDLSADGEIGISDVLALKPFFNKTCT